MVLRLWKMESAGGGGKRKDEAWKVAIATGGILLPLRRGGFRSWIDRRFRFPLLVESLSRQKDGKGCPAVRGTGWSTTPTTASFAQTSSSSSLSSSPPSPPREDPAYGKVRPIPASVFAGMPNAPALLLYRPAQSARSTHPKEIHEMHCVLR